jgi:hypothetical protein
MNLNARSPWFSALLMALIVAMLSTATAPVCGQSVARAPQPPEALPAAEFSRLIRELSEEGGFFPSDNFTSNESSYLTVVDKLRQLGATGGAYIGVGPEQNFTYIAKIRPRIAFIVDIRRQAMIQHLMYKAIFHLAPTRAHFISLLLSRPLPQQKAPAPDAPVNDLLSYFSGVAADDKTWADNLAAINKAIQEDFQFTLSETDQKSLEYVYKSFRADGLEIGFRLSSRFVGASGGGGFRGGGFGPFPNLKQLIEQTDLSGKQSNFLAGAEDYDFVRGLHRKNLIIPVVGDFSGKKALAAVGDYLRKSGLTVTAFYTSNVEQYLFESGSFGAFAENVGKLPLNDRSLFIRSASGRYTHPARLPGHRSATLLQQMTVFLRDYKEGLYQGYQDLIMTHYIAPEP